MHIGSLFSFKTEMYPECRLFWKSKKKKKKLKVIGSLDLGLFSAISFGGGGGELTVY